MQEKQPLGLPDRVVKITGTPDQLLRAVALLLTRLVESPNYTRFTTSNVSYGPPLAPVLTPPPDGPDGHSAVSMQACRQRHASVVSAIASAAVQACKSGASRVRDRGCMAVMLKAMHANLARVGSAIGAAWQ